MCDVGVRGGLGLAAPLEPGFGECITACDWARPPSEGASGALIGWQGKLLPLYIREARFTGLFFLRQSPC